MNVRLLGVEERTFAKASEFTGSRRSPVADVPRVSSLIERTEGRKRTVIAKRTVLEKCHSENPPRQLLESGVIRALGLEFARMETLTVGMSRKLRTFLLYI